MRLRGRDRRLVPIADIVGRQKRKPKSCSSGLPNGDLADPIAAPGHRPVNEPFEALALN